MPQNNHPKLPSIFFLSLMNGAPWGGSEELWYRTALYAARMNYKTGCAFYDWEEKKERIATLENAGCKVYLLPNKGRLKRNAGEKIRYKISKWKTRQMIAKLPFNQYQLTVVNLGGFEIYTSAWKDVYQQLSVYALMFHNYDEDAVFNPAKAKRLRQWISHASLNLFAARRIKETLEEKLEITVPGPGIFINPITITPSAGPAPYPAEPPVFVMLSELDISRKAQDNLIKALATSRWKARNWKLLLYGRGRDQEMLQQLVAKSGLEDKVHFKGHVADVKPALENAHLVLQLTHRDAMPLAVMEALATGRPVVVSKVGDMPYWVEEGKNGWISKNASVEEINATMERAWQQKTNWEQAGKNSFEIFKDRFPSSPEALCLEKLSTVLDKP